MNYNLRNYINVKNVFKNIIENTQLKEISFNENKENLALHLNITKDENKIDYYYVFGNSQVIRFYNENDLKVLTIVPKSLEQHIIFNIDDFMRGKKI